MRNAQAAFEFLTTYGWVLLILLITLLVLDYFDILNLKRFLPEKCYIEYSIHCVSYKVEHSKITLVISNGLEEPIVVNNINIGECSSTFEQQIPTDSDMQFVVGGACNNGEPKDDFKSDIVITYREKYKNITRTAYGSINAIIQ